MKNRHGFQARLLCYLMVLSLARFAGAQESGAEITSTNGLLDGGFELPMGAKNPWQPFQHAGPRAYQFSRDTTIVYRGNSSLRVSQHEPQVFGAVRQQLRRPLAGRYIVSAMMRTEAVDGKGWCLEVVVVRSQLGSDSNGAVCLTGNSSWVQRQWNFNVPPDSEAVEVIFSLNGNSGSGWADDVKLSVAN